MISHLSGVVSCMALMAGLLACSAEASIVAEPAAPPAPAVQASAPAVASAAPASPAASAAPAPAGEPPSAASSSSAAPPPASAPAAAPARAPITVPTTGTITLDDGTTITVENDDRVKIFEPRRNGGSDSHFGPNGFSYRKSVDFMVELQSKLRAGDREGLAAMMAYPLRVNPDKGHFMVQDRAAFVRDFERIFPEKTVAGILAVDPRLLFANYQGFMLGDGVIWGNKDPKGRYGLIAINQL